MNIQFALRMKMISKWFKKRVLYFKRAVHKLVKMFFKRRKTTSTISSIERRIGIYFILPCFLFLLVFLAYPLFRTIYLSFYNYNPIQSLEKTFAGIDNYKWLINDPSFLNSLYITILFTVLSVILETIFGLLIAVILGKLREGGIIKRIASIVLLGIFIIPWAIPGISAAVSWRLLYHPQFGPINFLLGKSILWLSNSHLALFSIIIADVWKCTPFFIIILFAAVICIPKEQIEAAHTDGATNWQEFRYIVLPSILPVMLVAFIFRAIDAFTKIFDLVYMLTSGGPGKATEVLPLLIFKTALKYFRFGTASALSVVAILISLVFGIWLLRKNR